MVVKLALQEFIEEGGFDAPIRAYTKKAIHEVFDAIGMPVESDQDRRVASEFLRWGMKIWRRCRMFWDRAWITVTVLVVTGFISAIMWSITTYLGK